ncbi:Aspartyl/glutamyl-tRNA(Asn/Gln) amidotransferase subunit C [Sporotomaculum syntrophicum]|uniref:Aspartyl/glutamyl-tRNA(Asn/Gln) amidotransferase subunit C n=1 Tax=Sporotomaculum syntrophicum TaxID=182264 RepID=A0A9D3AZ27_9FIRM|nr:Asp-tRNA(Asn)/Glu-tRNA(Gln) amidotransferase subunit GatC [Sporotomaculum syntrophicum]KAF1086667.1 Aspartyl/glutamyl-tRNA(Asn/Gln) amidotransferase subunit C [Sporotomaculum syntrophicum]
MKITEQNVEQVALFSRLELTEEDKAVYTESLNTILDYLDMLDKLDTNNIEPAAHVLSFKNVFREDKLQSSLAKELVLVNAPEEEAGCFKVPRIV